MSWELLLCMAGNCCLIVGPLFCECCMCTLRRTCQCCVSYSFVAPAGVQAWKGADSSKAASGVHSTQPQTYKPSVSSQPHPQQGLLELFSICVPWTQVLRAVGRLVVLLLVPGLKLCKTGRHAPMCGRITDAVLKSCSMGCVCTELWWADLQLVHAPPQPAQPGMM